jgi:hypothetical protein
MRVFSLLSLFLIHLTAAGCEEEARSRGDGPVADTSSRDDSQVGSDLAQDGPAGDGPVSDATVPGDGPVPQDGATTTLEIISPKAGTPLTEGASITLTGKGQGTLKWSYDANSDGKGEISIGTGASTSFKVPVGITSPKILTLFLADTKGKVQQDHSIVSGPTPDAGPPKDSAPPTDSGPPPACKGFVEAGGLVVMEVESAPVAADWTKRTSVAGYTGSGYYEWKHGDTSTKTDTAGQGILSYSVCVTKTGRYQLHIRSAAPNPTEHNDVWVRFPDTGAVKNKGAGDTSLGTGWFKVYQNTSNDTWQWKTKTTDNNAHNIFVDVNTAQGFKVELSGRSTQFKVDRIVLRHASVTEADATKASNPESQKK